MLRNAMTWLSSKIQRRSGLMDDLLAARRMLNAGGTSVQVPITEKSAIKFSAVFASVRIIAETKASLPIDVFERKTGKDPKVNDHPISSLLEFEPDPEFTPMIWAETRQSHLCLWGNSYTEIVYRNRSADVERLIPRAPWLVEPFRGRDGQLYYRVHDERGPGMRVLDRSQMLHVPGFSFNGIVGLSVVRHFMAESIGIGVAADRFVAGFYNSSGRPSIVVQVPQMLDDDAAARLSDGIEQQMRRSHRPLLLEHGAEMKQLTMPLAEAQLLESRKFQGEEIAARGFRLPPHVAGYLDHAKFNNIESQDRYFEKHTMRPWLVRDEQAMNKTLFRASERGRYYVKINSDGILRGDQKSRYDAYRLALLAGWKTINEIRELEDLEPLPGGDELPRPAAIWGKDDLQTDGGTTDEQSEDKRVDPRLQAITTQTLRGLVNREAVQLRRLATKPGDFAANVDAFYRRHASIVAEKLSPVAVAQGELLQLANDHRQALLSAVQGRTDLVTQVDRCVRSWEQEAPAVAERLLIESYQTTEITEDPDDED